MSKSILTAKEAEQILWDMDVISEGHFLLRSGLHSPRYVSKDVIETDWEVVDRFAEAMVQPFVSEGVEIIIPAAIAGIPIGIACTRKLSKMTGKKILFAWAEKDEEGILEIRRRFPPFVKGKRALCTEDIVTQGETARNLAAAVRACDAHVVGCTVMINRGENTAESLGVPLYRSVVDLQIVRYEPTDCPLCRAGLPLQKLGGIR